MKIPALVMAGGKGERLGLKIEKPLLPFLGRPLIEWVIQALKSAEKISEMYVATSHHTPKTEEKMLVEGFKVIRTDGKDYHHDMKQAVIERRLFQPLLVVSSDLPALSGSFIDKIVSIYQKCEKSALTVLVPLEKCLSLGFSTPSICSYKGKQYVVSGINIIDGAKIFDEEMSEEIVLSEELEAIININSFEDVQTAEKLLKGKLGNLKVKNFF